MNAANNRKLIYLKAFPNTASDTAAFSVTNAMVIVCRREK
jgi:hypothetical protein